VHTVRTPFSGPVDFGAQLCTGMATDVEREVGPDPCAVICSQLGIDLKELSANAPLYDGALPLACRLHVIRRSFADIGSKSPSISHFMQNARSTQWLLTCARILTRQHCKITCTCRCNTGRTGKEVSKDVDKRAFDFFNEMLDKVMEDAGRNHALANILQSSLGSAMLGEFQRNIGKRYALSLHRHCSTEYKRARTPALSNMATHSCFRPVLTNL
jgi:hypothetical protein